MSGPGQTCLANVNKVLRQCHPGSFIRLTDVSLDASGYGGTKMFSSAYTINKSTVCTVLRNVEGFSPFEPKRLGHYQADNAHDDKGFVTGEGFSRLPGDSNSNAQNILVSRTCRSAVQRTSGIRWTTPL